MLQIDELTHVYANGVKALDNVTLAIPNGMFGLLGPNGAGKSSLMRCIATLQTPSEGQIRFDDIDVIKEPEKLRRVLGYLPQDFGVYPRVSAYDMLDHMAILKGIADPKARKGGGRAPAGADQSLWRPQEGAGGLFRRDAADGSASPRP